MRTTRILLLISPALYAIGYAVHFLTGQPPQITNFAPIVLGLAGGSYMYAKHRGRSPALWSFVSAILPGIGPVILACLPDKKGSVSHEMRRTMEERPELLDSHDKLCLPTTFEETMPLVARCLSEMPEAARVEQYKRFAKLRVNFEFAMCVETAEAENLVRQTEALKITGCAVPRENHVYLFGAGMIKESTVPALVDGLRRFGKHGERMTLATHGAHGAVSLSEYNT